MQSGYLALRFSSQEMEMLFQQVFGAQLEPLGYLYIGKARWVRDAGSGLKHLFYLHPSSPGSDYYPGGAVSLDFVPRVEAGKVRIRQQARHARAHHSVSTGRLGRLIGRFNICRRRPTAEDRSRTVAAEAIPLVDQWLESFRSVDAVTAALKQQCMPGGDRSPLSETRLAYAFCLAKLGQRVAARRELNQALQSPCFAAGTHLPLRQLLARIDEL